MIFVFGKILWIMDRSCGNIVVNICKSQRPEADKQIQSGKQKDHRDPIRRFLSKERENIL